MSRFLLAALGVLLCAVAPAQAQTPVRFTNDWIFDGTTAWILRTEAKGYFAREGLAVTIDRGFGAGDAVIKVASGAYQMGFGDVSALINYNATHPERPLIGIMMIYDKAAFSVITLTDKNIRTLADLSGRKMAVLANEPMTRLLPALGRLNGFDANKVALQNVNPQIRDTLLRSGEVDAVIGFFATTLLNLEGNGVPQDKVRVFKYSDYGIDFYGSTIVTSAAYAAENPKIIAGFLNALTHGLSEAIKDPADAIPPIKARHALVVEGLERRRLEMVLDGMA